MPLKYAYSERGLLGETGCIEPVMSQFNQKLILVLSSVVGGNESQQASEMELWSRAFCVKHIRQSIENSLLWKSNAAPKIPFGVE